MIDDELIREIATKAFSDALEARSQELAEDIARRMRAALQPPAAQRERTKTLRDGSLLIAGSRSQTETLETLLAASSAITDGCGLLILRGAQAGGWSCHGLSSLDNFKRAVLDCSHGVAAKAIASCSVAEVRASELDRVFAARIGLDGAAKVVLIPVLLKGRVSALLLALAPEGDEAAALEVLVQVAQLALDVQAYRKAPPPKPAQEQNHTVAAEVQNHAAVEVSQTARTNVAGTAVAEAEHEAVEAAPVAESHAVENRREAESPAPEAEHVAEAPAAEPEHAGESTVREAEQDSVEAEPETVAADSTPEAESSREDSAPTQSEPEHEAVEATAEAAAVQEAPQPEPEAAYAPVAVTPVGEPEVRVPHPADVAPRTSYPAFGGNAPASQVISQSPDEFHQKARRFAKLLVEEIKLYNQSKVAEGRARGDLYLRLREDIEKSRAAYHKRYGESVRDVDYFSQELVRILADNNLSVMGAGFPG